MPELDVTADKTERRTDYEISENAIEDVVAFSRSRQVQNEAQSVVVMMAAVTGLMDNHEDYVSTIVTGSASSGKSHFLDNVMLGIFQYADERHDWVYQLTGGSDQAGINDPEIDDSNVAYFHELQKIPDEMLEFVKTVSEDGEFRYGRSQADSEAEGGFQTEHIERDPLPVIFSFADENTASAGKDQELRSRTVEVKVDEGPEKNKAVHRMKWGESHITLPDSDQEYIYQDEEMAHEVRAHVRDMPTDINVVLPTDDGRFEGVAVDEGDGGTMRQGRSGDDWSAPKVAEPLFNFARPDSTRASALLAGLTKGSALWNYHNRDAVCTNCWRTQRGSVARDENYECPNCEDEDLYIIAEPQDVGNLLACRDVLLATTHGMTSKKFAVLDALQRKGGKADKQGKAVQATKQTIVEGIQENDDIGTMTDSEVTSILDELDEHLIINKKDNPQDRRENLYVYDGGQAFSTPNIADYYDHFADVADPITGDPIEKTVKRQAESLEADTDADIFEAEPDSDSAGADGSLTSFGDGDSGSPSELDETSQRVVQRLSDTLGGKTVPADARTDLSTEHMVGEAPVVESDGDVRPEREASARDLTDGIVHPDHALWDGRQFDNHDEVLAELDAIIEKAVSSGIVTFEEQSDGSVLVSADV